MALQFDEPELESLIENVCRPAAEAAGLALATALDVARAGLIDDIMRIELRRARIVLVELTHSNRGAYWEGGFAEGLSKPVIYLCRRDVWEAEKTHFDTEHLHTVTWEPNNWNEAFERLRASMQNSIA